jgi:hypothetical protein
MARCEQEAPGWREESVPGSSGSRACHCEEKTLFYLQEIEPRFVCRPARMTAALALGRRNKQGKCDTIPDVYLKARIYLSPHCSPCRVLFSALHNAVTAAPLCVSKCNYSAALPAAPLTERGIRNSLCAPHDTWRSDMATGGRGGVEVHCVARSCEYTRGKEGRV